MGAAEISAGGAARSSYWWRLIDPTARTGRQRPGSNKKSKCRQTKEAAGEEHSGHQQQTTSVEWKRLVCGRVHLQTADSRPTWSISTFFGDGHFTVFSVFSSILFSFWFIRRLSLKCLELRTKCKFNVFLLSRLFRNWIWDLNEMSFRWKRSNWLTLPSFGRRPLQSLPLRAPVRGLIQMIAGDQLRDLSMARAVSKTCWAALWTKATVSTLFRHFVFLSSDFHVLKPKQQIKFKDLYLVKDRLLEHFFSWLATSVDPPMRWR